MQPVALHACKNTFQGRWSLGCACALHRVATVHSVVSSAQVIDARFAFANGRTHEAPEGISDGNVGKPSAGGGKHVLSSSTAPTLEEAWKFFKPMPLLSTESRYL
jgi:hypothetical protein